LGAAVATLCGDEAVALHDGFYYGGVWFARAGDGCSYFFEVAFADGAWVQGDHGFGWLAGEIGVVMGAAPGYEEDFAWMDFVDVAIDRAGHHAFEAVDEFVDGYVVMGFGDAGAGWDEELEDDEVAGALGFVEEEGEFEGAYADWFFTHVVLSESGVAPEGSIQWKMHEQNAEAA
jgi:hypothetical protein